MIFCTFFCIYLGSLESTFFLMISMISFAVSWLEEKSSVDRFLELLIATNTHNFISDLYSWIATLYRVSSEVQDSYLILSIFIYY